MAEEEAQAAPPEGGAKKKAGINKILIIVIVALLIVQGVVFYLFFGKSDEKNAAGEETATSQQTETSMAKECSYVPLAEDQVTFTVGPGKNAVYIDYIAFAKVDLPKSKMEVFEKELAIVKPAIKDKFRGLIVAEDYLKLQQSDTQALKKDMLKVLEKEFGKTEIVDIVFDRWQSR